MEVYGIKNCDTVKKALKWLENQNITVQFHDFKQQGPSEQQITTWADAVGWQQLLNKRSTTFRNLADEDKTDLDQAKAIQLMLAQPTLIKRPVVEYQAQVKVGFKADDYQAWLQQ